MVGFYKKCHSLKDMTFPVGVRLNVKIKLAENTQTF